MKIYRDISQGSKEWAKLRSTIPTASEFKNIVTPTGNKSDGWNTYMSELLANRILGRPEDGFVSKYMMLGSQNEDRAVASYELRHDVETEQVGFVTLDNGAAGCSPDRLIVGSNGLLEAKGPGVIAHIHYEMEKTGAAKKHTPQLQGQLFVCDDREFVDIVSFFPGLPDVEFRVTRDEVYQKKLNVYVLDFSRQLDERTDDFKRRGWLKHPAHKGDAYSPAWMTDADAEWAGKHYERKS